MTLAVPPWGACPDAPVFSAPQFTGRAGLAHNLLGRCLRRQSILLYGGPKLGKTSLLLHLKWLMDQNRGASSTMPAAVYLDLSQDAVRNQLLSGRWADGAPVVLLDNCEHLGRDHCVVTLREFMKGSALGQAVVWAGARSWRDFVLEQVGPVDLRPAPLAVLLQGEARGLLEPCLAPTQLTAALAAGGTHPYVLKVIANELVSSNDPKSAISSAAARLVPFFQTCREALQGRAEEALLLYLARQAHPVNPRDAAVAVGLPSVKAVADALCCIGLISRWNLNEGAMLQANCRIFNEWYLATSG
jgi:hypothetical protein